ncbi:MAG: hypothetical protein V4611_03720 [Patescibacteria group bacterium]
MPFVLKPIFATYIDWSTVKMKSRERLKITTEEGRIFYFKLENEVFPSLKVKRLVLDWSVVTPTRLEELLELCRVQVDGDRKSSKHTDTEIMEIYRFQISAGSRNAWNSSAPELGRHLWTTLWRRGGGSGTQLPGGLVTGIESVVLPRNYKP